MSEGLNSKISGATEILNKSSMPDYAKQIFHKLLEIFKVDWHLELYACEDQKGSGSNTLSVSPFDLIQGEVALKLQKTIQDFLTKVAEYESVHGKKPEDPLAGYANFIEDLEWLDWEDDFKDQKGFSLDLLNEWCSERINYYRTVKLLKLNIARETTYKEIESQDFGGLEGSCRVCGVFFFDNLERHNGVAAIYCSVECQTKAHLSCIQCAEDYIVGNASLNKRLTRLMGFCTPECLKTFKDNRAVDSRYIGSIRQKIKLFGGQLDESVTRRALFEKSKGICNICKKETKFVREEDFDPLLATVDHIIPWTKGGSHTWDNVQLCCFLCNIKKGNRPQASK
jgi:hypothetical protein